MKITYIHQYFEIDSGGTRSYEFSRYLVNKGHEVTMITGSKISEKKIDGIKIKSTKTAYGNNFSFFRRVLSFIHFMIKSTFIGLKDKDSDIVFATSTPITVGIPALIISKIQKKKFVFEVRDVWPDIPIKLGFIRSKFLIRFLYKLEKSIYRNADHIVVLSIGMKDRLIEKGVPEEKLSIITNLSINEKFNKELIDESSTQNQYYGKLVCIHPGTMGFVNGLDFILDVAQSHPDEEIIYLLIGDGNQKDRLLERIKKNGIKNVIIKDKVSKNEIIKYIKRSDVGIVTVDNFEILKDNSANKFFDFLAAGKPIILNYEGWQKKVLEDNGAGKGFKYSQKEEFYKFLVELKNDQKLLHNYGENSKYLAVNKFDSKKLARKLEEVLFNVLNEK